jgi:hypothetical protein
MTKISFFRDLLSSSHSVSSKRISGLSLIGLSIAMVFMGFTPDYYTPFLITGGSLLAAGTVDHWSGT